jgi:hypothetical protein
MLYYTRWAGLPAGLTITSGNWGRLVLGNGPQHSWFYRECVWELVREAAAPHAVSRLACAFVFDDLQVARRHGASTNEIAYEVTLAQPEKPKTRVDMAWISAVRIAHSTAEVRALAANYWTGQPSGTPEWELLTESNLILGNPA